MDENGEEKGIPIAVDNDDKGCCCSVNKMPAMPSPSSKDSGRGIGVIGIGIGIGM